MNFLNKLYDSAKNYSGEILTIIGSSNYLNDISTTYRETVGQTVHRIIEDSVNFIPSSINYVSDLAGGSLHMSTYDLPELHDKAGPVMLFAGAAILIKKKWELSKRNKTLETFDDITRYLDNVPDSQILSIQREHSQPFQEEDLNDYTKAYLAEKTKNDLKLKLNEKIWKYLRTSVDKRMARYHSSKH